MLDWTSLLVTVRSQWHCSRVSSARSTRRKPKSMPFTAQNSDNWQVNAVRSSECKILWQLAGQELAKDQWDIKLPSLPDNWFQKVQHSQFNQSSSNINLSYSKAISWCKVFNVRCMHMSLQGLIEMIDVHSRPTTHHVNEWNSKMPLLLLLFAAAAAAAAVAAAVSLHWLLLLKFDSDFFCAFAFRLTAFSLPVYASLWQTFVEEHHFCCMCLSTCFLKVSKRSWLKTSVLQTILFHTPISLSKRMQGTEVLVWQVYK